MSDKPTQRRYLKILVEKEREHKALEKLRRYGKLLMGKKNHNKRQKALRELKVLAKELNEFSKI